MLEKEIEKKVCKFAEENGWLQYKFVSTNMRGVPDRVFFKAGMCFFIEFKAPGKKPTALQIHHMGKLKAAGFLTFVVDNVEAGKKIIRDLG